MVSETRKTDAEKLKAEAAKLDKGQRFIEGKHVGLRAVTDGDLGRLAALMSECPLTGDNPQPWTEQSLRKLFEDEKKPGLWDEDNKRYYVAVSKAGDVVGFVIQSRHFDACYELNIHIGDSTDNRDAVGTDMLKSYMQLTSDWLDPVRLEHYILQLETGKASWLEASGFEMECTFEEVYMYQGKPVASQIWGWVNPRVLE